MSEKRFILDSSLGRLARYLRMLGYDTIYLRDATSRAVVREVLRSGRILLTRTRELAERKDIDVLLVKSDSVLEQLKEVCRGKGLSFSRRVMTRCLDCNQPLENIEKLEVLDKLPPHVKKTQGQFAICPVCKKIFWPGTHYARSLDRIIRALREID